MFMRTHAQASPSVTMEKGVTRLGPPPAKAHMKAKREPYSSPLPTDSERKAAAILASIALATLVGVCLVLYLMAKSSRWELLSLPFSLHSKLLSSSPANAELNDPFLVPLPIPRILIGDTNGLTSEPLDASEQFLSYLPHSGFHNQRIALENALTLAYILNRTLLVPPIHLGNPPLRYRPSSSLRIDLALSTKIGLEHCPLALGSAIIPEECTDFWDHAHIPWDWLVDLQSLTETYSIRTLMRWDLTDTFLRRIQITSEDTYFLNDTHPYQFRFFDRLSDSAPLGSRYKERVDINTLATLSRHHRLLQFGTLFGTTRVRLVEPTYVKLRRDARQSMVFTNSALLALADKVRDSRELGGTWGYASVHLRLGDGVFADGDTREENVRHVWWKLVRELGMDDTDSLKLESRVWQGKNKARRVPPTQSRDTTTFRTPHPLPPPLPSPDTSLPCRRRQRPSHPPLDIPLYIATDKPGHHSISIFTRTFPCVYFLSNFSSHFTQLDNFSILTGNDRTIVSDRDALFTAESSVPLTPFLPPFLDAIVASKARIVIGTPGSTFSRFVEDVLWRQYHGWEIVQRG